MHTKYPGSLEDHFVLNVHKLTVPIDCILYAWFDLKILSFSWSWSFQRFPKSKQETEKGKRNCKSVHKTQKQWKLRVCISRCCRVWIPVCFRGLAKARCSFIIYPASIIQPTSKLQDQTRFKWRSWRKEKCSADCNPSITPVSGNKNSVTSLSFHFQFHFNYILIIVSMHVWVEVVFGIQLFQRVPPPPPPYLTFMTSLG